MPRLPVPSDRGLFVPANALVLEIESEERGRGLAAMAGSRSTRSHGVAGERSGGGRGSTMVTDARVDRVVPLWYLAVAVMLFLQATKGKVVQRKSSVYCENHL